MGLVSLCDVIQVVWIYCLTHDDDVDNDTG